MFWNGLNKTENFEKTQKAIHFDRFLIFSWNRPKTLRNPICFEMDWIKQKIPKRHKKLYTVCVFSKPMDFWMGSLRKWSIFFTISTKADFTKKIGKFSKKIEKISKHLQKMGTKFPKVSLTCPPPKPPSREFRKAPGSAELTCFSAPTFPCSWDANLAT